MRKIGHIVKRPGLRIQDDPIAIPVPEELETVPGVPVNPKDVEFYSREYPLESFIEENSANVEWAWSQFSPEERQFRRDYDPRRETLIKAAKESGDLIPTGVPTPNADITKEIRDQARQLDFAEVGFTRFDLRYTYRSKKKWVQYEHAICLAMEQDFEATQTLPSMEAEYTHERSAFGTYYAEMKAAVILADYIRSLGYHAQIHSPNDNSAVYIPMFVQAGLGQLGANGQLLSPHFGSRARIMIVTTDAPVKYDQPVDYGIHRFCQKCQVCTNRCPGRALTREKVWYRGIEKNKLITSRCWPVMARYELCGVCMKVCPVQRFGMKAVMEHYVDTGEVLGKGTHGLEGYSLPDKGYFGPGELPHFGHDFFQVPRGRSENWLFEEFKSKLVNEDIPDGAEETRMLREFKDKVTKYIKRGPSVIPEE